MRWTETGCSMPESTIDAALTLLAQGRDVLLVGDDGSGKTWCLSQLAGALRKRGNDAVVVPGRLGSAADPLAPFAATTVPLDGWDGASAGRLVAAFAEELNGPRSRLLVDDLDALEVLAIAALRAVLDRTGARLVATAGRRSVAIGGVPRPFADLLAERAPADVAVPPLSFEAMSRFVAARLRGRPDAELIVSLSAHSGSNPRAAAALVDVAVASGAIGQRDGLWSEVGALEEASAASVVHAFTGRLSPEEQSALELLAWAGPLPPRELDRLVDPAILLSLNQRGRLSWSHAEVGHDARVSPPALSRGLREQLTPERRYRLVETVERTFGADFVPDREHSAIDPFVVSGLDSDDYWRWSAEFAGQVKERVAVREAAARALWTELPTVENACAYFRTLTVQRPAETLGRIFAETRFGDRDSVTARLQFSLYELQWLTWTGADDRIPGWLDGLGARLGAKASFVRKVHETFRLHSDGVPLTSELIARLSAPGTSDYEHTWSTLLGVALLLEAGSPEDALERIDTRNGLEEGTLASIHLDFLRTEALLALGRLEDAEEWSRRCAEHAYDQLSPLGFQFHALGVAQTLVQRGRFEAAWRALSTGLRLGSGGPFAVPQPPLLLLGAIIQAQLGDLELAAALLAEGERTGTLHLPPHPSRAELARAAILRAEGDLTACDALLWEAGAAEAALGHLATACMFWTDLTAVTLEQAAEISAVMDRIDSPLHHAVFDVKVAMGTGDERQIVTALDRSGELIAPQLAAAAVDAIDRLRAAAGQEPLDDEGRAELIGDHRPRFDQDRGGELLSDREREVAILAKAGLSNRDMAHRLFVSVRTIENHMHRLLKKLGYSNRRQLRDEWNPDL
ncbi:DNA-binding CsgD family transcriptional regulator/energy-coupling factor transporter ATP-binding protein EcfA2 [Leifsonia sp. EB34]